MKETHVFVISLLSFPALMIIKKKYTAYIYVFAALSQIN
jgi:hypothetical protein